MCMFCFILCVCQRQWQVIDVDSFEYILSVLWRHFLHQLLWFRLNSCDSHLLLFLCTAAIDRFSYHFRLTMQHVENSIIESIRAIHVINVDRVMLRDSVRSILCLCDQGRSPRQLRENNSCSSCECETLGARCHAHYCHSDIFIMLKFVHSLMSLIRTHSTIQSHIASSSTTDPAMSINSMLYLIQNINMMCKDQELAPRLQKCENEVNRPLNLCLACKSIAWQKVSTITIFFLIFEYLDRWFSKRIENLSYLFNNGLIYAYLYLLSPFGWKLVQDLLFQPPDHYGPC